jgi:uncharacterized protein YciI
MFVILLKLTQRKTLAPQFMQAHNEWIRQGCDAGVFALVGSLQAKTGGALLAVHASMEEVQARVAADPFVAEGIVTPEIYEIAPGRMDERLLPVFGN